MVENSVEVATSSYSEFLPPMRSWPYAGAVEVPVQPFGMKQTLAEAMAGKAIKASAMEIIREIVRFINQRR